MANEAKLIIETGPPIAFTVSNTTGIEKGALLSLADPMTVATHASAEQVFGGIAASEKIANDGKVKLGVYRQGIFKVVASGSITAGDACALSTNVNLVKVADSTCTSSKTIGIALETASAAETFLMELRPAVNNAGY